MPHYTLFCILSLCLTLIAIDSFGQEAVGSMYDLSQSSIGYSSDIDYNGASFIGTPIVNQDQSLSNSLISGPNANTSVASVPPSSQDHNLKSTPSIPPLMDLDSPLSSKEAKVSLDSGRTSAGQDGLRNSEARDTLEGGCMSQDKMAKGNQTYKCRLWGEGLLNKFGYLRRRFRWMLQYRNSQLTHPVPGWIL